MPAIDPEVAIPAGRWRLRLPRDDDAERISALCQDPEIARWTRVPSPYGVEDARAYVATAHDAAADGTAAMFVVVDGDGVVVGACGLVTVSWHDLAGEVGYWVGRDHRGRGMAVAATRALCRWAFDDLGLQRLDLQSATANTGSNAVARTLGFTLEGTARQGAIEGHAGAGRRVDVHHYGLLPGELRE